MDSVFQRMATDHSLKKTCSCTEKQKSDPENKEQTSGNTPF